MSARDDDAREAETGGTDEGTGGKQRQRDQRPDDEVEHDRWDENDPRRAKDQMAPPTEPCQCYCLHCHREFNSDEIWFQKVVGDPDGFEGFWRCPTPNCDGAGFTFDIHPTDPEHPANAGWSWSDDDEGEWDEDEEGDGDADASWDPDESKWKELDEELGEEDDDIEGEEWKHGLAPGEQLPEPPWAAEARRHWEEQEKRYDAPDERPRELDWTDQPSRRRPPRGEGTGDITEDDIPF